MNTSATINIRAAKASGRWLGKLMLAVWVLGALTMAGSSVAAVPRFWQLTFSYDPQSLVLVKASPITPTAKDVRTPDLEGAVVKLSYEIAWLNEAGDTLLRVPVTVPLGLRVAPDSGAGPSFHDSQVPATGVFILRVEGPSNPADVRSFRLLKAEAGGGQASDASATILGLPAPFLADEHGFVLPETSGMKAASAPAGPLAATKIRHTGPDTNRLVIVVMGDGYTQADLTSGAFSNQVIRFFRQFFAVSPWNAYSNAVNVYRVDLVSNQSGADYEDASPAAGGTLKDTYLGAQFWAGGVERCLYIGGSGITRAYAAADSLVGVGLWDKILVFVNSTKYGGCGGAVGVSSAHTLSDEIQVHEFGHSFAGLADEYDYDSTSTNCVESTLRNVACGAGFPNVKWAAWVEPGTPIPTPETSVYANVVGAFEGALYQASGVFRPMLHCKMQTLGDPFCRICAEAHVLKLFERISLVDQTWPAPGPMEVFTNAPRAFGVTALPVVGLSYRWFLGGVEMPGETNSSVSIHHAQVTSPNQELRLAVTHSTPLVRAQAILADCAWQLNAVEQPSLIVADVVVSEGDDGLHNVALTIGLSSPSTGSITVDYASGDGTATAGADFLPVSGQIVFQPGETAKTADVAVVGESLAELNEVFYLNLSNPIHAALPDAQIAVTIRDDDDLPSIGLTSPTNGSVFAEGESILVSADTSATPSQIAWVDIFKDGSSLFRLATVPFATNWTVSPPGIGTLMAVAMDSLGRSATSAPVNITVLPAGVRQFGLLTLTNGWKFDVTTNDYGAAWKEAAFDDSGWRGPSNALFYSANGPLAGPKKTPLSLLYNGTRVRSLYFRTHFFFPEPPPPGLTLLASNLVDDGAVLHLNGVEAGRIRMPAIPISRTNLALPGPYATNFDVINLDAGSLVQGDNVMAVEVHLASETSTAMSFGMSLHAVVVTPTNLPPVLAPIDDKTANEGSVLTFAVTATDPDGPSQSLVFSLEPGVPVGASMSAEGVFLWTPALGHTPTTNPFTVRVIDGGSPPLSATQNFAVVVNHLPVPASPLLARYASGGLKIRALLLLGTDPDGDPLVLSALAPTSANGGAVSLQDGWVIYTPPPGMTNQDSFDYTVGDGRGGSNVGTVSVAVVTNAGPSFNLTRSELPGGQVRLRGDGIPQRTYTIEFSESLSPPVWQLLATIEADEFGIFDYIDAPPAGAPARFYRAVCP